MMRRAIVMAFLWIGCSYAANVPLVTFPAALGGVIEIKAAVVDSAGNIYVTGVATKGLPVTSGVLQPALNLGALCFQPDSTDCTDAFVAKFSPAGQLIYATYLGGSADDGGTAIAVDNAGNAYVTGYTYSHDFPLTANAFQKTNAGSPFSGCCQTNPEPGDDAFVAKLNSTGTALIYSTFLGGSGVDVAHAIQVDSQQNSYVAGQTDSTNFPVTPGTYSQKTFGLFSGFVTKINAAGRLAYSTYFDAGVSAIALDASGSVSPEPRILGSPRHRARFKLFGEDRAMPSPPSLPLRAPGATPHSWAAVTWSTDWALQSTRREMPGSLVPHSRLIFQQACSYPISMAARFWPGSTAPGQP